MLTILLIIVILYLFNKDSIFVRHIVGFLSYGFVYGLFGVFVLFGIFIFMIGSTYLGLIMAGLIEKYIF